MPLVGVGYFCNIILITTNIFGFLLSRLLGGGNRKQYLIKYRQNLSNVRYNVHEESFVRR